MPEPIVFTSRFRIKPGSLEFMRQLAMGTAGELETGKPRTALFLVYLDEDGGAINFLHAFADQEAMDMHFEGANERASAAAEHMTPMGWEVYGRPSAAALDALRGAAQASGVRLTQHPEFAAGFLRIGGGR